MKNILFIHSSSEFYGSDKSLYNLVANLNRNQYKISVILPCDGPLVQRIDQLCDVKIIKSELAVLRRKNFTFAGMVKYSKEIIKSVNIIRSVIKENQIDIVYTNTSVIFPGAIAAKIERIKSVWHIREIISNKYERFAISKIVNIFSDIIVTNSKATAAAIIKKPNKLRIVYNAIESKQQKIECNYKDNKKTLVVGMAGRINRWKGQKLFIDMAEKVLTQYENVKFLIAGSAYNGEEYLYSDLEEYINKNNLSQNIELLGLVNDMDDFYSKLDIFILPSIQPEPFGLVVIEAMDKALPVVATNHGGPTEIIENGVDGYLVNYTDSIEMSKVVLDLLNDEKQREKIGSKAKLKRDTIFTISNYVNQISNILESL